VATSTFQLLSPSPSGRLGPQVTGTIGIGGPLPNPYCLQTWKLKKTHADGFLLCFFFLSLSNVRRTKRTGNTIPKRTIDREGVQSGMVLQVRVDLMKGRSANSRGGGVSLECKTEQHASSRNPSLCLESPQKPRPATGIELAGALGLIAGRST